MPSKTRRGNATEYSDYIACDIDDYEKYKEQIQDALESQVEMMKGELGVGDEVQSYYRKPYIRFEWSIVVPDTQARK